MSERIAVLGAGTMGRGIAQVCATFGLSTRLFDVSAEALEQSIASIHAGVEKGIAREKIPASARDTVRSGLVPANDLASAVEDATIVIEAAPESLELKQEIFRSVAEHVSDDCILGTNTSSLPITGIAAGIPGPDRVIGLHFFNPVPAMKLVEIVRGLDTAERVGERTLDDALGGVEIVRGLDTAERVVERSLALCSTIEKEPIVVRDSPGFATSRLGVAIGLEAIRMLESGVASAEEIDRAMELGYRHPMGPLRLTDLVGLDVRLGIAEYLHETLGSEAFAPPALLREMVAAGKLGKKSGQGFYDWSAS